MTAEEIQLLIVTYDALELTRMRLLHQLNEIREKVDKEMPGALDATKRSLEDAVKEHNEKEN